MSPVSVAITAQTHLACWYVELGPLQYAYTTLGILQNADFGGEGSGSLHCCPIPLRLLEQAQLNQSEVFPGLGEELRTLPSCECQMGVL